MRALLVTACGCTRYLEIGEGGPPLVLKMPIDRLRRVAQFSGEPMDVPAIRAFELIGHPTSGLAIYQEILG